MNLPRASTPSRRASRPMPSRSTSTACARRWTAAALPSSPCVAWDTCSRAMLFSSLRAQLLFCLLAPLGLIAALDAWATHRSAQETATIVQERMLVGAARVIGEQVHLEED